MKLVFATPLYPPDIAEPAPYIKELATRMAKNHEITIVTYARFPEKIPGVRIFSINKRLPLPFRLIAYTFTLLRVLRTTDIIYAENGASVEIPVGVVSFFTRRPLIMHIGDAKAHKNATEKTLLKYTERFAFSCAKKVFTDTPPPCPETLPFSPTPEEKITTYRTSWETHIKNLENLFQHYV